MQVERNAKFIWAFPNRSLIPPSIVETQNIASPSRQKTTEVSEISDGIRFLSFKTTEISDLSDSIRPCFFNDKKEKQKSSCLKKKARMP